MLRTIRQHFSSRNGPLRSSNKEEQHVKPSVFWRLPPEIRLQIYDLLLVYRDKGIFQPIQVPNPRYVEISRLQRSSKKKKNKMVIHKEQHRRRHSEVFGLMYPSIMLVCRRLYAETIPVLYGKNLIDLTYSVLTPMAFLQALAPVAREAITHLRLSREGARTHEDRKTNSAYIVGNLPNLQALCLPFNQFEADLKDTCLKELLRGKALKTLCLETVLYPRQGGVIERSMHTMKVRKPPGDDESCVLTVETCSRPYCRCTATSEQNKPLDHLLPTKSLSGQWETSKLGRSFLISLALAREYMRRCCTSRLQALSATSTCSVLPEALRSLV